MNKFPRYRAICTGLVVLFFSITSLAAKPLSSGLGQAWPNMQDVSASTHWHVYVFANNGIRYVQVNDLYGNVRVAFGVVNDQFLVLPMGRDAERMTTPQQMPATSSTAVPLTSYTETVYREGSFQLNAIPLSNGTTMFTVEPNISSTLIAPCDPDKEDCNTHLNSNSTSSLISPCDPDKEDCNTHLYSGTTSALAAPCDPDKEDCNTHLN